MIALQIIAWSAMAAMVSWSLTRRHASAAIRRSRAEAQREIGIAHAETTRARARAAQLSRELASWTAGCKQGREDVITLMPLILAQANPAAAAGPDANAEDRA